MYTMLDCFSFKTATINLTNCVTLRGDRSTMNKN